eukprot:TRINITY_DN9928_c0_g1_i1.p1 TRINITY_DN9928_c0_g1~~TRINITY_DN9928_c0_g1_i1.p1  ORF type:complete len:174 (+),score=50.25 TRINITY_DN9928_c0_g1_i1:143-664(+)
MSNWPALRLALDHRWGEKNRRRLREVANESGMKVDIHSMTDEEVVKEFGDRLINLIENFKVYEYHIEEFLEDFLDENFFMVLEDGSQKMVASAALKLFNTLEADDESFYNEIIELAKKNIQVKGIKGGDKQQEEKDDDEPAPEALPIDEEKEQPPLVDEDGFTLVVKKKKNKK